MYPGYLKLLKPYLCKTIKYVKHQNADVITHVLNYFCLLFEVFIVRFACQCVPVVPRGNCMLMLISTHGTDLWSALELVLCTWTWRPGGANLPQPLGMVRVGDGGCWLKGPRCGGTNWGTLISNPLGELALETSETFCVGKWGDSHPSGKARAPGSSRRTRLGCPPRGGAAFCVGVHLWGWEVASNVLTPVSPGGTVVIVSRCSYIYICKKSQNCCFFI